jgi:hypothetical protein
MNIWTRKSCVKWLPRVLTIDQNQHVLMIRSNVFRRYITMDVKLPLHNTPKSNQQSAEWTERDEPNPKRGKTKRSACISITGCVCGIIFIDYLEKGQTINSEALLERLNDEIQKKRPI